MLLIPALGFAQLRVSVTDRAGEPVLDLPQSEFHVLVDGRAQPISSFRVLKTPLSIGLVIDNSARMRDYRSQLTRLRSVVADLDPRDEMFILGFNDTPYLDQDFTNDAQKLENSLDKTESRGWAIMRDAVNWALDHAQKFAKNPTKILVLISASEDDSSTAKLEDLVEKARSSGVAIYAIGLLKDADREEKRRAQHALKELAVASGGAEYELRPSEKPDNVVRDLINRIRNEYAIGYAPVPGHPKVVVDFPGLMVRVEESNRGD